MPLIYVWRVVVRSWPWLLGLASFKFVPRLVRNLLRRVGAI